MTTKQIRVNLSSGLHARPATKFVQLAKKFRSKITVSYNGKQVDPKSIIALLSLNAVHDALITISAEGEDENQAVEALCEYVQGEE